MFLYSNLNSTGLNSLLKFIPASEATIRRQSYHIYARRHEDHLHNDPVAVVLAIVTLSTAITTGR